MCVSVCVCERERERVVAEEEEVTLLVNILFHFRLPQLVLSNLVNPLHTPMRYAVQ